MTRAKLGVWMIAALGAACGDGAPSGPGDRDRGGEPVTEDLPSCDVPTRRAELIEFLRAKRYETFAREDDVHPSAGPHGGDVLTYVNPTLERSLAAGAVTHPICSASVKELYLGEDRVSGWAVYVKIAEDSDEGRGFFWLETLSTDADAEPDYEGLGVPVCVGCHEGGTDYVLTSL